MSPAWDAVVPVPEIESAVRAAQRLARAVGRPTTVPTPLVLHGPPGVGKSLVVATLVRTVADAAGRTVATTAAHDLDVMDDDDPFAPLADADLAIVEDIQHLPPRAVAGVCRLLEGRGRRRIPTVLTANDGPARLTGLPHRLTSRLAAGLVVRLDPPCPASRRLLLEAFADRRKIAFTADALDWLVGRAVGDGARPLIGFIERLARLVPDPKTGKIKRSQVADALADAVPTTTDKLVPRVAAAFRVKPKELTGPSRLPRIVLARQVAMYLGRKALGLTLAQTGVRLGRDTATVIHSVQKIDSLVGTDPQLAQTVQQLWTELT